MRRLNPAESCWEAGEVYPWCLSTCRSPAWELSSQAGEGWMDGSSRGAPYPGVFAGKKKKKIYPENGPEDMEQGSLAVHTSHR